MPRFYSAFRPIILGGLCAAGAIAQPAEPDGAPPASAKPAAVPMIGMGGARPAKPVDAAQNTTVGDGRAEGTLAMDVRKFDFEGTKAANRMYMPSGVPLSSDKPQIVTKEPRYNGKPSYATVNLGNGTPSQF